MNKKCVKIIASAAITPAGSDINSSLESFFDGKPSFSLPDHFDSKGLSLGICRDIDTASAKGNSRAERLLNALLPQLSRHDAWSSEIPLYLATTVGSIDLLENSSGGIYPDATGNLLECAGKIFNLKNTLLVSAACASGQKALVMAAESIIRGQNRYALVVGCDICSEFVTSGFFSLGALSHGVTSPYDADRDGLTLGEAAGAVLLAADDCPEAAEGYIRGWGETCDAAHITAPDVSGVGLVAAIADALTMAGVLPEDIAGIMGHGTGTVYNDQAEIAALNTVFNGSSRALYSLKGNIGHTLGATGVLQNIFGVRFAQRGIFPPQAGLKTPMKGAEKMVSAAVSGIVGNKILSLNIGFGGLNSAIILEVAS